MLVGNKKISIDPNSIAIALTTLYPKWYKGNLRSIKHIDKVRGDLALEFVRKALKLGYKVVVLDAQSTKTFEKELQMMNGAKIIVRKSKGRSADRRQVLKVASKIDGIKAIVTCEPEKVSLLECIDKIVKPILNNSACIVVPKREENLFKSTYPDYMYESETEGNKFFNENLKLHNLLSFKDEEFDIFFGPKAFRNDSKILALFIQQYNFRLSDFLLPSEYINFVQEYEVIYFPVVLSLKKNFKVKSVEIPFSYPKIQKENEEVGARELFFEKRRLQKVSLLVGLMHFINYLEKKKNSGVVLK